MFLLFILSMIVDVCARSKIEGTFFLKVLKEQLFCPAQFSMLFSFCPSEFGRL